MFDTRVPHGRGVRFEVEGVEVGISGLGREKLLFTSTEVTTGWVRSERGNYIRMLDEGTRGVGEEAV